MSSRFRRFKPPTCARRSRTILQIERLEERAVPATFTVINLNDAGAGSLRAAVVAANAAAGTDDIVFQNGLTGTITLTTGQISVTDSVNVNGPGAGIITVSGNNASRHFYVYNNAATIDVSISGLTLTAGNALNSGGAILALGENLTVNKMTFNGNTAPVNAGAIGHGVGGTLTVQNSTFTGNSATGNGGAISTATGTNLAVTSSTFTNNVANTGGAVSASQGNSSFTSSTFTGNTARPNAASIGGAINLNNSIATITDSLIQNNSSANSGGGIEHNTSPIDITNTTIAGNTSAIGGGMAIRNGTLNFVTSTLSGNTATNAASNVGGGGMFLELSTVRLTNSTVSGNTAAGAGNPSGGGIFGSGAGLTLRNATISNNSSAGPGGGIFLQVNGATNSGALLQGSMVANSVSGGGTVDLARGDVNQTFGLSDSLVENAGAVAFSLVARSIIGQDPVLGPLANNGGPTQTHALLLGSPAIDTGTNAANSTFDQRGTGFPRQVGTVVDIGAFEFTPPPPTPVTPTTPTTPTTPAVSTAALNFGKSAPSIIAIGQGAGGSRVVVFDAAGGLIFNFAPFEPGFRGGIRVALGDVTGDAIPDIIVGAASGNAQVRVFEGASGQLISAFSALNGKPKGGVNVAAGDVNGDGRAEVIVAAGKGDAPLVEVWNGNGGVRLRQFFAYDRRFRGGVTLAVGDINGDGFGDIITAPQSGTSLLIAREGRTTLPLKALFPYGTNFPPGVTVASADMTGDGRADIITGTGRGGPPFVRIFDGGTARLVKEFVVFGAGGGGVNVAVANVTGDARPEIIANVFRGPIQVLDFVTQSPVLILPAFRGGSVA